MEISKYYSNEKDSQTLGNYLYFRSIFIQDAEPAVICCPECACRVLRAELHYCTQRLHTWNT